MNTTQLAQQLADSPPTGHRAQLIEALVNEEVENCDHEDLLKFARRHFHASFDSRPLSELEALAELRGVEVDNG